MFVGVLGCWGRGVGLGLWFYRDLLGRLKGGGIELTWSDRSAAPKRKMKTIQIGVR